MKWCFLVNNVPFLMKFLSNVVSQAVKKGDECVIITNSKVSEYIYLKYFPKEVRVISRVDWCKKYYKKDYNQFENVSWRVAFADVDRYPFTFFRYNSLKETISQVYQFYDSVLQIEQPTVVVSEPPANIFTEIAYVLCQKYHISYLGFLDSCFEGRIQAYNTSGTNLNYEKTFQEMEGKYISEKEKLLTKKIINDFLSHTQLPSYQRKQNLRNTFSFTRRLLRYLIRQKNMVRPLIHYVAHRHSLRHFDYESELFLWYSIKVPYLALKSSVRVVFQKYIFDAPKKDDAFFLFPLQLQPEASISVLATYFSDQLATVKNIAFCLPFPYKLYVKEHPAAFVHHPTNFYRELKKIPQVRLISPFEDTENLIKKAAAVITLTSTVGIEAAFEGKRVYVLGEAWYAHHPLCKKIESISELERCIQKDLKESATLFNLENVNIRFMLSHIANTFIGDFDSAEQTQDLNNYKTIYEFLKKIIRKKRERAQGPV